jgi:7-carboxy-7-deazaguanine synthase
MSKFHYTEKFISIQGEGRYTGVPSVFLRMFGCNFRCKSFGIKNGLDNNATHNPEVVEIIKNITQYKTFEDLPLVETGCDSYSSIYPEFKRFVIKETAQELAQGLVDLLPYNSWRDEHLIITGGEPLLGWQKSYPSLLDQPIMQDLKEITFETNGTQRLQKDFRDYLINWGQVKRRYDAITFSVSAKLSCSGEARHEAILPDVVCSYQEVGYTLLKFVVSNDNDVDEAIETLDIYRSEGFAGPCYLMAEGGTEQQHQLNKQKVAQLAIKYGLRYSPRLQVDLFKNAWST